MKQIAKKSLALLLAVCFMLTTAIVALPISVAAAATECDTWDEVVAAGADASIKLTADVTATSSIASFSGTFDGNGKTVTVSDSLFGVLADGATVKNLTVASASAISAAPLAGAASGNVAISNVTVDADASIAASGSAFIGKIDTAATVALTNCVNNADISGSANMAGFIGQISAAATVTFTNCVNNGAITTTGSHGAGFIACIDPTGAANITFEGCANNGKIFGNRTGKCEVAGFVTYLESTEASTITFKNCLSAGALENLSTSGTKYSASGFMARAKKTATVSMENCLSIVPSFAFATEGSGAFFWSVNETTATVNFTASNSYYLANEKVTALTDTETAAGGITAATADQLKSGEIAYKLGSAWGQKIGTDNVPVIGGTKVLADGNNYYNEAESTDTPDLNERFSLFIDAGFATVTVDGPKYMTVGSSDAITVTFDVPGKGTNSVGAGFVSSNTGVVDFPGEVVVTTDTGVQLNEVTNIYHENSAFSCWTDQGVANEVVITIPVSALAAGKSDITLLDIEDGYLFTFCDADMQNIYQHDSLDIGYSITVVDENGDEPTDNPDLNERFSYFIDAGFATVTVDGPKYMKVGDLDAITVTFNVPGKGTNSVGVGFVSSNTTAVDFPGEVVVTTDTGVQLNEVTNIYHENSAFSCWTDQGVANEVVITIPVSALAAGTSDITLLDIEDGYLFTFCDADMQNIYQHDSLDIGYSITVVGEGDTPVVEESSTTLDATIGSLTVTGPATAVAGESFDVTFTWSGYDFIPDALEIGFYLNTITSQAQAGNIAVSGIKSTNLTSYAESFVGITDVDNLYKIALTDMVVVEGTDTVEIVVTFNATTPGYTGFSLYYAELSNPNQGYTHISYYDKAPAEAYVVEITVPETSHTVIFKDGDTTLETATGVAYGAILTDVYTAPVKEGYTFKGWTDADGNAVTTVTGDITVYADYDVNEYTVNITVNNGSATNATQKLDYAGSIDATVNAALAAAGLKPATGYTDSYTVSTPSVAGTTIGVTVTYSTLKTYTVTFKGQNGSSTITTVTVEHGKAATAPTAPAVEGYTFTGWDKDFSKVTSALTVTAVYEINKYTVTFKGQDGATLKTQTVEHGKAATAPSIPTVEGYTFKNWDKAFNKVTGDLTVTAVYTINSYNVTVTVKSEGDFAKTTANYGTSYTLPSEADIKSLLGTDDIFAGWSINGKTYAAGDKVTITADTVITAILSNVKYFDVTIKDATETTTSYAEGKTFTVPAAAGKTGYTFINWTDAKGNVYTAGQTVTVTADITLTANYQINKYTVKFIGKDGSIIKSETVEYGKAATAPTAPTVTGYTFSKWDKDFSKITGNLDVTAVYTINSYDIVITDHNGTVKTVKANYGANVLDVVNANYTKDASLVFVGFYNSNGTLISSTGKVTAKTLVYVAYTVEDIYAGGNANIVFGDGIITYYAGADVDAFEYGTVAKNGGTGDTITFTAPLLVADAIASKISYAGETATYTIIVMGDVDGDADVDLTDAELAAACIGNSKALSGNYYTAANTTAPAALITARDIAAIKAFARGNIDSFVIPSGN